MQLLHTQIPKVQSDTDDLTIFCAFGIFARKSCMYVVEIDPSLSGQIPKAQKDTDYLTILFALCDLCM